MARRRKTEKTLRDKEALLSKSQAIGHIGSWELDIDRNRLTWSDEVFRIFGLRPQEFSATYEAFVESVHPEDRTSVDDAYRKSIEEGLSGYQIEHRIIRQDSGEVAIVYEKCEHFKDASDRIVRSVGIVQDITEQKQAEEALIRVAKEWQTTFDSTNDAIWILDKDQRVMRSNKTAERYFRRPSDQMIDKHCWEIVHGTDQPIPECPVLRTRKSLHREKMELKIGERWFEITVDPILDEGGQFDGAVHFVSDITEQKLAVAALLESEEKFKTLVEKSPLGISLIEQDGRYQYINPRFKDIFGYTIQDIPTGAEWFKKAFPNKNDRDMAVRTWIEDQKQIGVGQARPRTYLVTCKDGSRKEILFMPVAMENQKQFVVYEDITEKSIMEQQLAQAQKMESVGRLAGGVAHDFNNMLGVIIGYSELAIERVDPISPVRADLKVILSAAHRSADLTRQLLAFARKQTAQPRVLELNDTVSGMLKMLQRLIGEDIDLSWRPGHGLWPVKIDPGQIDQILANLCVNARDAISGVGKVTIETENAILDEAYCALHEGAVPGEYVMLTVSDNGHGMDKEALNNCFEPFFTTKEVSQGTGMGLATVFGIVKQNDGFINVYSEPGQGVTFKIYLPRTQGLEKEKETVISKEISKGTEIVLLVEDEESILSLGKAVLERFGYTVLTAHTPSEALALAKQCEGPIHLLVTDVVMPEMNGKALKDAVEKLKPDIKILFMSGYTANVVMHRGILEKDVHFIQKPFSVNSLAGKVREVLDQEKKSD